MNVFDQEEWGFMSFDPREQQFWTDDMTALFDLDSCGNVKPMANDKLEAWSKMDVEEKMTFK